MTKTDRIITAIGFLGIIAAIVIAALVVWLVSVPALTERAEPNVVTWPIDFDCNEFQTWEDANLVYQQMKRLNSNVHLDLDGDGDGVPCENLLP